MNQLFVAVAFVSLAATGCVNTSQFARNNKNCGPACHVARSQSAPRPEIIRTAFHEGGVLTGMLGKHKNKKSCDPCCGCDECCECTCGQADDCCCPDECCDCTCGCPDECCDCTCGCPDECCDCTCGCPDESCDCTCGCPDECCDPGCGCEDPCCGDCCDDRNFCQKLIDRIASGGCGDCKGGRGSGGVLGSRKNRGGCNACSNGSPLCPHAGGYPAMVNYNPGPPVGQTAYPYYTTRGPRDFLQNNPPTIGPY